MPIRVVHQPSMALVGQLGFQTGQLEAQKERRRELEAMAMKQAEMRQRAQMQQQQIASSLKGQQMSHMNAMQRLAVGQQYGQINADQAEQWKVKADIQAQENRMLWGKQLGQNQLDLANLSAGVADQKNIQRIQNEHRQKLAFQNLNPTGEGEWLNIGKQIAAARLNKKIDPAELPGHIAQLQAQQDALEEQDEFTYGKRNKVGYEEADMWDEDGQPTRFRFVSGSDPDTGEPIIKFRQPTSTFTADAEGNQTERPLTTQEHTDQANDEVIINGYSYPTEWDEDLGRMKQVQGIKGEMTPESKAAEEEEKRAEEEREARKKWYFDREKDRLDVLAKVDPLEDLTLAEKLAKDPTRWHANYAYPEYRSSRDLQRTQWDRLQQRATDPSQEPVVQPPMASPEQPPMASPEQPQRDRTKAIGHQLNPWPFEQVANAPSGAWVIPGPGIPAMIKD